MAQLLLTCSLAFLGSAALFAMSLEGLMADSPLPPLTHLPCVHPTMTWLPSTEHSAASMLVLSVLHSFGKEVPSSFTPWWATPTSSTHSLWILSFTASGQSRFAKAPSAHFFMEPFKAIQRWVKGSKHPAHAKCRTPGQCKWGGSLEVSGPVPGPVQGSDQGGAEPTLPQRHVIFCTEICRSSAEEKPAESRWW